MRGRSRRDGYVETTMGTGWFVAYASTMAGKPSPRNSIHRSGGEVTVSAALRHHLREMQACLDSRIETVSRSVTPANVHACRTHARRIRAFLRTFRHAFNPAPLALYEDLLRRLTRDLAPLRSADVEQQVIERLMQGQNLPREEGLEDALAIAARIRLRALWDLKAKMNGGVWLRRLERLQQAVADPRLIIASRAPMAALTAQLLRRRRRRLRRQFRSPKPSAESLHKRRMKVRALRYVLERCAPDTAALRGELEQLRVLQDCLGELHDEWVLRQRLGLQRPQLRVNIEIRSRLRRRREELLRCAQKHQNQLLRIWKDMQPGRMGDSRFAAVA